MMLPVTSLFAEIAASIHVCKTEKGKKEFLRYYNVNQVFYVFEMLAQLTPI